MRKTCLLPAMFVAGDCGPWDRKNSFFESQSESPEFPKDFSPGRKVGLEEEGFWPLLCFLQKFPG